MSTSTTNVVVPISGDGPIAPINFQTGEKTVQLTGTFEGRYVLLGSQNDIDFTPVLTFDSDGKESIKRTLSLALSSVRVRSQASNPVGVTVSVIGVDNAGVNAFGTVASIPVGGSGQQPIVPLGFILPVSSLEQDTCFLCVGSFQGILIVEGSVNGVDFNPIGDGFRDNGPLPSLLGTNAPLEFSPLVTGDLFHFVRVTLDGVALSPITVTIGGSNPTAGSAGIPMDLIVANAGGTALQALGQSIPPFVTFAAILGSGNTLDPSLAYPVIVGSENHSDGANSPFSVIVGNRNTLKANDATSVLVGYGNNLEDTSDHSVLIGSQLGVNNFSQNAIVIGIFNSGILPIYRVGLSSPEAIVVGTNSTVGDNSPQSLVIGSDSSVLGGFSSIAIGTGANLIGFQSIMLGGSAGGATQTGNQSIFIGFEILNVVNPTGSVCIGHGTSVIDDAVCIGFTANAASGSVTIGPNALTEVLEGMAIGSHASVFSDGGATHSMAIGPRSTVNGFGFDSSQFSMAVGPFAHVTGDNSVAIGNAATAGVDSKGANGAVAIGGAATVSGLAHGAIAIGNGSLVAESCAFSIAIGEEAKIGLSSNESILIAHLGSIGDNAGGSIVIGQSTVGTSGGTHALDNTVLGNEITVADGTGANVILGGSGGGITINTGVADSFVAGHNLTISGPNQFIVALNTFGSIGSNASGSIGIGAGAIIGDSCSASIAIGRESQVGIQSDHVVCLGFQARVGTISSVSVAINSTIGDNSTGSVAINSKILDGVTGSLALGGCTIGAIGGTQCNDNFVIGNTSGIEDQLTNCVLIGGGNGSSSVIRSGASFSILLGSRSEITTNSIACTLIGTHLSSQSGYAIIMSVDGTVGTASDNSTIIGRASTVGNNSPNSIIVGTSASIGDNIVSAQAYGSNAVATQTAEVIFNANGGGGLGVSLFHAVSALGGNPDLLKFDGSALVNNHDSAMFLLYKDSGGTVVLAQVKVDNVTGALTVPL